MISNPTQAALDVLAERRRQIEVEGFDAAHDDRFTRGQLAEAAVCYAMEERRYRQEGTDDAAPPGYWPWGFAWWKPKTRRENLVKAAALILAEIERLDRAAATDPTP